MALQKSSKYCVVPQGHFLRGAHILRHCGVPKSTPLSSGFARLVFVSFCLAIPQATFANSSIQALLELLLSPGILLAGRASVRQGILQLVGAMEVKPVQQVDLLWKKEIG